MILPGSLGKANRQMIDLMPRKNIQYRGQVVAIADEGDVVARLLADEQKWDGFAAP